jgi:hypothetical protein
MTKTARSSLFSSHYIAMIDHSNWFYIELVVPKLYPHYNPYYITHEISHHDNSDICICVFSYVSIVHRNLENRTISPGWYGDVF